MTDVIRTPSVPKRSQRGTLRRMLRNPLGILSLSLLALIVLAAVFAPLIAPFDPNYADVGNTLADPGGQNLLGTDSAGRDVFSRLLYGARLTLLSALLCAIVAIAIGLPSGSDRRLLQRSVRQHVELVLEHADGPPRHRHPAVGPRGARTLGVDLDDLPRHPPQPELLPPDPHRRAVRPQ